MSAVMVSFEGKRTIREHGGNGGGGSFAKRFDKPCHTAVTLRPGSMAAGVEGALERVSSTEPVPRPRSPASGSIGWVCKRAFVNRKTSASDTLRKSVSETLKLGDPLIDPFRPFPRKARPVLAGGNTTRRKLGEFHTDFLKRQPDPLREDNKGNTAKHRSGIAPMP
jgi:hypothetical protein